jgi:hypothetical protein
MFGQTGAGGGGIGCTTGFFFDPFSSLRVIKMIESSTKSAAADKDMVLNARKKFKKIFIVNVLTCFDKKLTRRGI